MNSTTIETGCPMELVMQALRSIHAEFLDRQQEQLEADAPLTACHEIQGKALPPFVFSGDWKRPESKDDRWTMDVESVGDRTQIRLQMINDQPTEYHIAFRMFSALARVWASEYDSSQG